MNPVLLQKRRRQSRQLGAIDINSIIRTATGILTQIASNHSTRQQAEAARTQLQQQLVQTYYNEIHPRALRCEIDGVQAVNELIAAFLNACGQIPYPNLGCENIANEARGVWIRNEETDLAACAASGQTPNNPTVQNPNTGNTGNTGGVIPISGFNTNEFSNYLPLILLGVGALIIFRG